MPQGGAPNRPLERDSPITLARLHCETSDVWHPCESFVASNSTERSGEASVLLDQFAAIVAHASAPTVGT